MSFSKSYSYSKLEYDDPEEAKHRRARFLICKSMKKVDSMSRPSWLRVKVFKVKMKIGRRLKKLRKGFSSSIFSAKVDFTRQISCVMKSCRFLVYPKQDAVVN